MQFKINLSRPSLHQSFSFLLLLFSNNSILISHRCFSSWKSFPWIGNFSSSLSAFYIKLLSNTFSGSNLRRRDYVSALKLHYAKNMFHIKTSSTYLHIFFSYKFNHCYSITAEADFFPRCLQGVERGKRTVESLLTVFGLHSIIIDFPWIFLREDKKRCEWI